MCLLYISLNVCVLALLTFGLDIGVCAMSFHVGFTCQTICVHIVVQ